MDPYSAAERPGRATRLTDREAERDVLDRLVYAIRAIGHVATRWGLDHFIGGVPLEDLIEQDFAWQEGWEYQVS